MTLKFSEYFFYPGSKAINIGGQFLDALLIIYFLHKFFPTKQQKFERLWFISAVLMTILTQMGDYLSGNNTNLWMFLLFAVPFIYTLLFYQGKVRLKFLICEVPFIILISLEQIGVMVTRLANELIFLTHPRFLVIYLFRRIILKLVLLFAVKFLLKCSIYDNYYELKKYWSILGILCFFEYIILRVTPRHRFDIETTTLHLVISVFCFLMPMLFYYVVYLMGTNFKNLQMAISQKNYIDAQEQYMTQLMTMQESLQKFKHDYKAHLFCIDHLLLEKNYEEAHVYLETIHNMEKNYDYFRSYSSDNRINVLLNQMRISAERNDIHFTVTATNVTIEKITLYDLNMILSNLYSNAAEAALHTKEKKIHLSMEKNRAYLQIIIQNSVTENPLKDNPSFLKTSKKDKEMHGFGMKIIRSVVEKY